VKAPLKAKGASAWRRLGDRDAGTGYDLAANIIVGLGLGWLAQKLWPAIHPWGYGGGIILGTISGFYQIFKSQQRASARKAPE
jgi:F0F1-type ATP synthase assembly protein I